MTEALTGTLIAESEIQRLADALRLCGQLDKRASRFASRTLGDVNANPDSSDFARIASKADSTQRAIADLLITVKVYGEVEAADVL